MRVAIYARRSTEEHQAESLDVQNERAEAFAVARGWSVVARYSDSAVSRAEFKKRPGLIAVLNAAAKREFDAVVTRDESRLGGDMHRVGLLIQDLTDAGVQLWYYFSAERVVADDATSRFMVAVRSFASELEREKLAGRTREHLERKARAGYVVGGRVYGYDNRDVMDGERRARVEYVINEAEAAVVREVFKRYAAGESHRAIAADLNARGVSSPRAGRRGTRSWSPSAIWAMVHRERYRGVLVWGRVGAAYKGGTRVAVERPASEWVTVQRPDLRIVDEATWSAVVARPTRQTQLTGSTATGRVPRYLLTALARCGQCGGPMQVSNTKVGATIVRAYHCGWARDRGPAVCTNKLRRPVAELNGALVAWLTKHVLSPAVVAEVLAATRRRIEAPAAAPDDNGTAAAIEAELGRVLDEIDRVTAAIATTDGASEALARGLVEREKRARGLRQRLDASARARAPLAALDWAGLEARARADLADLRTAFADVDETARARAALAALLRGPVSCSPVSSGGRPRYRLSGVLTIPLPLEAGTVNLLATPTGADRSDDGADPRAVAFSFVAGARVGR